MWRYHHRLRGPDLISPGPQGGLIGGRSRGGGRSISSRSGVGSGGICTGRGSRGIGSGRWWSGGICWSRGISNRLSRWAVTSGGSSWRVIIRICGRRRSRLVVSYGISLSISWSPWKRWRSNCPPIWCRSWWIKRVTSWNWLRGRGPSTGTGKSARALWIRLSRSDSNRRGETPVILWLRHLGATRSHGGGRTGCGGRISRGGVRRGSFKFCGWLFF